MDLFLTCIRLKNDATVEKVWNIMNDWLVGSPTMALIALIILTKSFINRNSARVLSLFSLRKRRQKVFLR